MRKVIILSLFIIVIQYSLVSANINETRGVPSSFIAEDYKVEAVLIDTEKKRVYGAVIEVMESVTLNVVDSWVTNDEPHKITGLEMGKSYVIKEIYTPKGYIKSEDIEFTVTGDGYYELVAGRTNGFVMTGDKVTDMQIYSCIFGASLALSLFVVLFIKEKKEKNNERIFKEK